MKKFLALWLTLCLFLLPISQQSRAVAQAIPEDTSFIDSLSGMNDPDLLPYLEDTIYTSLVDELDSEEYFVEEVKAVYISQEYLDEVAFNSQANIFFGYTLAELDEQFTDSKYIFTLGDDGSTVVEPFTEYYDDTYERIIKNVAMGTGVILICVTVSVISAGVGAGAVSVYFAVAAQTGTATALSGSAIGAASSGLITYVQTGNIDESLKSAALGGSEGFKWGAISGCVQGLVNATEIVGNTMFFKQGTPQSKKYPHGVRFEKMPDGSIYLDFKDYSLKTVKFPFPNKETALNHTGLSGNYYWDSKLANAYCGLPNTPSGYVWHHVEDMQTMMLVPQDLHSIAKGGMPHDGGASLIRKLLDMQ